MIKALLLDFNGVIIDDESIQMRAFQELLSAEGIDFTDEDYEASHGMDDHTFVRAAYERKGKTVADAKANEIVEAKFAKWREVVGDNIPLFPGIPEFIEKMAREFTVGIVSMERGSQISHVLDASGLSRWISTIVSSTEVTACKPDPLCYRTGFRNIDAVRTSAGHAPLTHEECLVIEDTAPGVRAARAADLRVLGVTNTVSAAVLREAGAGAIAKDLRDWMPDSFRLVFD